MTERASGMSTPDPIVFDQPHYDRLNTARAAVLRRLLAELEPKISLKSALDAGCGTGYFSAVLRDLGLRVAAFDGRPENTEEARRRHPGIEFRVGDVESIATSEAGSFDLVLCLGLLYHLENPFRAIRNLQGMTGKLLVLEGICLPGDEALLALRDENHGRDQGLHYIAFYPSEACLTKMLYRAGFRAVYRLVPRPDHNEYRDSPLRNRSRTMLAAARESIAVSCLELLAEPATNPDPWETSWARFSWPARRLYLFLTKPWALKVAAVRRRLGLKQASS